MDPVARAPEQLRELPEHVRLFFAGIRPDELARLKFIVEEFQVEDLQTLSESFENLRSMKRFGRFGMWFFGFIAAGAAAAAAVQVFFGGGGGGK